MTLFSLLTVFSASIAWFGMNKDVGASGNQVAVNRPSGKLASIDFFTFDNAVIEGEMVVEYKFFPTIVGSIVFDYATGTITSTGNTNTTLDNYTPLHKEHPLLMIFNLDDEYALEINQFRIEAITQVTSFLGEKQENGAPMHDLSDPSSYVRYDSVLGRPLYALSSVTQFLTQELTVAAYDTLMGGETLDFVYSELVHQENFVTITSETEVSTFNSNPNLYISSQNSVAHIALIIDFFPDAVEFIYSTYIGNKTLEETYDYELHFECDWSLEVFG